MLSVLMLNDQSPAIQGLSLEDGTKSAEIQPNTHEDIVNYCRNNEVDIILMDTDSVQKSEFNNLIFLLRKECKNAKLVYISHDNDIISNNLAISKSDSLLNKNLSYNELIATLTFIKNDYRIFPNSKMRGNEKNDGLQELTPREIEVLNLICQAKTRPEISKELSISENTLKTHIQNILNKTNYNSISKLALDLVVKGELSGE